MPESNKPLQVYVVFNQCPAFLLGAYGSFAGETPNINRLASLGTVYDQCFAAPSLTLLDLQTALEIEHTVCVDSGSSDSWIEELNGHEGSILLYCEHSCDAPDLNRLEQQIDLNTQRDEFVGRLVEECEALGKPFSLTMTALAGDVQLAQNPPEWMRSLSTMALQVPLIKYQSKHPHQRRIALPTDLQDELIDQPLADRLVVQSEQSISIRTPTWLFVQRLSDNNQEPQSLLFKKPEDRWEVLDVADQYPDVVEQFSQQLTANYDSE